MKRLLIMFVGFIFLSPALAFNLNDHQDAILNQVSFRLSAEQWVTTKSALVNVSINIGVSDSRVEKVHEEVLKKLSQISDQGEWHIISFDRSQDQSGLEKIQVMAQARLASSVLSGIRDKAKSLTKPGETYSIDSIQFTPSDDEMRAANATLRSNIYQQAKEELDRLNKLSDQKYYIHNIDFAGNIVSGAIPQNNAFISVRMTQGVASKELPVGDKLIISAAVDLAAVPEQLLAKLPH